MVGIRNTNSIGYILACQHQGTAFKTQTGEKTRDRSILSYLLISILHSQTRAATHVETWSHSIMHIKAFASFKFWGGHSQCLTSCKISTELFVIMERFFRSCVRIFFMGSVLLGTDLQQVSKMYVYVYATRLSGSSITVRFCHISVLIEVIYRYAIFRFFQ